jgi:hypothetical protein
MNATTTLVPVLLSLAGQHPAFHPRDASIYFEVPDLQLLASAYGRTSLWRMLSDADVHTALGPLVGKEALDPREKIDELIQQGLDQAHIPSLGETGLLDLTGLSFSLALPLEQLAASGADVQALLEKQSSATLVLELASPEAAEALTTTLAKLGLKLDASQPVQLWRDDRYVALLAGGTARADFEKRLVGEAPTFADRAEAEGATAHFTPESGVTVIEGYSALGELSKAAGSVPFFAEAGPLLGLLKGTIAGNLGVLLSGGHFRMQLRDGLFVTESFRPEAAGKPSADNSEPITGALSFVDPQALIGGVARLDTEALVSALVPLHGPLLAATGEGAMAGFEESYGFRPDRDLIETLGGAFAFSLAPITGPTAPDFRVVCALKDRERFLAGMEGLGKMVTDLLGDKVEFKASTYRKTPLFTFSWRSEVAPDSPIPIDIAGLFKPTISVLEDRVVLTLNSHYAKDEVRRLTETASSSSGGGAEPSAGVALAQSRVPADATEAGFSDWIGMVARVYTTLKSLAPMAASFGAELPFDVEMLPDADVFTRFFRPGFHWQKRVEGGVLCYSESSLGPEFPLLLLGGAGAAAVEAQSSGMFGDESNVEVVPAPAPAPEPPRDVVEVVEAPEPVAVDRGQLTRDRIGELEVAIAVYCFDQSKPPAALADLEHATPAFPTGFLDGGKLPTDGWDRAFRYERTGDKYRLWSLGPDGVDQKGAGDDVLSGLKSPPN